MQGANGAIVSTNHALLPAREKNTIDASLMHIEEDPKVKGDEIEEATSLGETSNDSSRTPTPEHVDEVEKVSTDPPKSEENSKEECAFVELAIEVDVEKIPGPETSLSTVSSTYDSIVQIQPSPSTSTLIDENSSGPPVAPSDELKTGESSSNQTNKRRAPRRNPVFTDDGSRKSTRITRNTENAIVEVVNNYAGSKEHYKSRNVQYPKGIKRIDYEFPVKSFKENGRLRIDMNGPVTRSNPVDNSQTPLKRNWARIQDGEEYQATLPEVRPFSDAADEPDREEAIWIPPEDETMINKRAINMSWVAISYQFDGTIPLDAMLHRLMVCEYDVQKMLQTIELERHELPQPFQPLSVAQQAEFEKQLKRQFGSNRANSKSFRNMQERFLRNYHLGEIVNYYYRTKKRSCLQQQLSRCQCRESLFRKFGDIEEQIECANCTKGLRSRVNPDARCAVCMTYQRLFHNDREPVDQLLYEQSEFLRTWNEMEENAKCRIELLKIREELERQKAEDLASRPLKAEEIATIGAAKRKDKMAIAKLLSPYNPQILELCPYASKAFLNGSKYRMKEYSFKEKLKFIQAFEIIGSNPAKVASFLNVEEDEAAIFFARFDKEYSISLLIQNSGNNNSNYHRVQYKEKSSRESTPYEPSSRYGKSGTRKRKSDINTGSSVTKKRSSGPKTRSRGK